MTAAALRHERAGGARRRPAPSPAMPEVAPPARWLPRAAAAHHIGVSESTFDRLRKREQDPLPEPVQPNGSRLACWDRHELDEWMAGRRTPARRGEVLPPSSAPLVWPVGPVRDHRRRAACSPAEWR
jgi:predicted DNA-binding transcriptional regulator AlpA